MGRCVHNRQSCIWIEVERHGTIKSGWYSVAGNLKIHLKPKERIYINGALIRVDRRVTLELLNETAFILESHVLSSEEASTPLRQLYFVVQSILMEPQSRDMALQIYHSQHRELIASFKDRDILDGLVEVKSLVLIGRTFDALKLIRSLYELEDDVLSKAGQTVMLSQTA